VNKGRLRIYAHGVCTTFLIIFLVTSYVWPWPANRGGNEEGSVNYLGNHIVGPGSIRAK
jgi:hypothetical protein